MKSRCLEYLIVSLLLLFGFAARIHNLPTLPAGFSDEELVSIRITENIRDGNIRVFFDTTEGGVETLFHMMQMISVEVIGDGLYGYRILPLLAGLMCLALVYTVARRLFGVAVALIALSSMCFGIWPVLAARTASHISLVGTTTVAVLWYISQSYYLTENIRPQRPRAVSYTMLALAVVVAIYTHYTGLLALLGLLLFVFYLHYSRQPVSRSAWWNSSYTLLLVLILSLPYLISVLRDSSASGLAILWTDHPRKPLDLIESIGRTALSFFLRGDRTPSHNVPGLPLVSPVEGVLVIIGLATCIMRWRQPNYGFVLLFFGLGLLPDMWLRDGPDYEAMASVNPLVYLLIGIGLVSTFRFLRASRELPSQLAWLREQRWLGVWPKPLVRLFLIIILLTMGRNLWQLRHHLFSNWPDRLDTQNAYHTNVGQLAIYLDHNFEGAPVLLCSPQIVNTEDLNASPSDLQILQWMMHREDLPLRVANCRFDLVLLNGGEPMRILFTDAADPSTMPSPLQQWLYRAEPLSSANLPRGTAFWLDAEQALADMAGQLISNSIVYYPREPGQDPVPAPLPTRFGGNMTFLGHMPLNIDEPLHPGDTLTLVTYWRVDGPLLPKTGTFIRLHDTPQASPYSEINLFDVNASLLQPRDVVVQVGYLIMPTTLRDQEYRLTIGVFDEVPINQLPVYDSESGMVKGAYLLLGEPFMVTSP